jgi:hypothetical protein
MRGRRNVSNRASVRRIRAPKGIIAVFESQPGPSYRWAALGLTTGSGDCFNPNGHRWPSSAHPPRYGPSPRLSKLPP